MWHAPLRLALLLVGLWFVNKSTLSRACVCFPVCLARSACEVPYTVPSGLAHPSAERVILLTFAPVSTARAGSLRTRYSFKSRSKRPFLVQRTSRASDAAASGP